VRWGEEGEKGDEEKEGGEKTHCEMLNQTNEMEINEAVRFEDERKYGTVLG
jgi:hypothetical protein